MSVTVDALCLIFIPDVVRADADILPAISKAAAGAAVPIPKKLLVSLKNNQALSWL